MRRILTSIVSLSVVGLFFAVIAISSAEAKGKPKEKHTVLERLHHAHKLLSEADHDYDGHRAKAAEEVHHAIVEIEGKHHAKPAAPDKTPAPAVHESQTTSDAQLRKAREILQEVETELKDKHPKAHEKVTSAIHEIDTALGIK